MGAAGSCASCDRPAPRRGCWPGMLGVASGAVLVPLNSTMLAVALPSVMGEFAIGPVTVSSLVTLYLGAVTVALPASGSLGDRYGQRRVFLTGVVAFAAVVAARRGRAVIRAPGRSRGSSRRSAARSSRRRRSRRSRDVAARSARCGLRAVRHARVDERGDRPVHRRRPRRRVRMAVAVRHRRAGRAVRGGHRRVRRPAGSRTGDVPVRRRPTASRRSPGRSTSGSGPARRAADRVAGRDPRRRRGRGRVSRGGRRRPAAVPVRPLRARQRSPAVDPRLFTVRPFAAAVLGVLGATVVLHGGVHPRPAPRRGAAPRRRADGRAGPARDLGGGRDRGADRRAAVGPLRAAPAGPRGLAVPDCRARRPVVVRRRQFRGGDRRSCSASSGWVSG